MTKKPTCKELERRIKELQSSEAEKTAILNATTELVTYHDTDLKVIWANKAAGESVGLSAEDLVGRYCYEVWCRLDEPLSECPAVKAIKTGKLHEVEITSPAGRSWIHKGFPLYDKKGRIKGVVTTAFDITKRKLAEKALIESEKQYRFLVENLSLGVALIDLDHNVIMTNEAHAKMFNKHPNELIGKKCFQEFEKREKVCSHCPGVLAINTGQAAKVETAGVRDDGSKFAVRICAFPVFGSNDTVTGFIEIVEDITEKNELEAQLQMSQKMEAIGTLAGGIAHDFNNLLMAIQGNASLMFKDIDSSHPHCERLKSIEKQIQSGVKLTSQLLGYARKGRYEVIPLSFNQIVNETSDTFGQTKKEIVIHKKLAEDLFAIEADHGQIEQVLLNLFVNAADAMPRGGDLYLETKNITKKALKNKPYKPTADKYVLLIVKDTGIGMDKSIIEHIFEPFFTTKEMGRGTGLGLASVYGIIKAHGGYIDVESKEKHGTTFRVYLPVAKRKIKKVIKTSDEFIKGTGTVLLVDDEEIIRDVFKDMLETIGYKVFSAKDGKEAIEIYRKNQNNIDIVLLDMIMPNIGGGEAYDRLKEINPDIKVLLSSGYSIDSEATEILNRGCNSFIQKPFNINELSGKIKKILNKK